MKTENDRLNDRATKLGQMFLHVIIVAIMAIIAGLLVRNYDTQPNGTMRQLVHVIKYRQLTVKDGTIHYNFPLPPLVSPIATNSGSVIGRTAVADL